MLVPRDTEPLTRRGRWKVWALALASAPLMTFAHPPVELPWVGLVAMVPLFVALPRLSAGGAWLATFLVMLMYFWVNTWWLGQMTTDPGSEIYVFFMFVFVATYMPLWYGFAGMAMRWLMTRRQGWLIWLVPLVWLGFEFVHEFDTPAPFPWLPVAYSVTHFTSFIQTADLWGAYGVSAAVVLVNLAVAALFELRGPNAMLALAGGGSRPTGAAWANRASLVLAGAAVLIGSCIYGSIRIAQMKARQRDDGPLVGLVQGNLPQEVKVRHDPERIPRSFAEHLELTRRAVAAGADLICWPETMLPGGCTREGLPRHNATESAEYFPDGVPDSKLLSDSWVDSRGKTRHVTYVERLRALIAHEFVTPMLIGAGTPVPPQEHFDDWKDYTRRRYNSALLFDAQGRYVDGYDKRYIVPGGEYVPLESNPLVRWIVESYAKELQGFASYVEAGVRRTLFQFSVMDRSQVREIPLAGADAAGDADRQEAYPRTWAFTASICYEYAWPGCYIELHKDAQPYPDFHVNISNEGWFKRSAELDQAMNYCRFRCIESRVPMVRATNTGISSTIDACGRVREVLTVDGRDREVAGLLLASVPVIGGGAATPFIAATKRYLGFLALGVSGIVLALMTGGRLRERHQRRAERTRAGRSQPRRPAGTGLARPQQPRGAKRKKKGGAARIKT